MFLQPLAEILKTLYLGLTGLPMLGGERFEVRKVCFSSDCLNVFATGCSYHYFALGNVYDDYGDGNHDYKLTPGADPENSERGG